MSVLPTLPTLCFQNQNGYMYLPIFLEKYSNKLSMKALVEKDINEETRKRDEEGSTFLLCTFIFFIW